MRKCRRKSSRPWIKQFHHVKPVQYESGLREIGEHHSQMRLPDVAANGGYLLAKSWTKSLEISDGGSFLAVRQNIDQRTRIQVGEQADIPITKSDAKRNVIPSLPHETFRCSLLL